MESRNFSSISILAVIGTNNVLVNMLNKDSSNFLFKSRRHGHSAKGSAVTYLHNNSFPDKTDDVMQIPLSEYNEDVPLPPRKHPMKKSPKRTIQKIIRKNRKNKKFFFDQVTSLPTVPLAHKKDLIVPDEPAQEDDSYQPTTQSNQKKKLKKWHAKIPRYPMPFQKARRDGSNFRRTRREADRDNTLILQDFDEVEFLNQNNNYDTVKVHSKKYW